MSYPSLSPAPTTNQPPRVAEISADDADAIKQEMNRLLASPVLPPKRTHRVSNSRITPGNPPVAEDSSVRGGSAFGGFGAGNKRTVERQRSTSRPRHPWSISDDAPDTSMLPPRQSTAAVTSVGGLIINALAEKKLQDAKKTKLEQMEERMTKRLNEAPTARGLALERAASKQLVGQNLGGMKVGWVEWAGDIYGWQGLTLVHYSAQFEPFLTQEHTLHTPDTPYHPLNTPETTPDCTPCHTEGAEVELKNGRV